MVFFDLDGFKQVNDVDGHAAGDARWPRSRVGCRAAVRADDFCARFGGDEFVVLCEDADAEGAALRRRADPRGDRRSRSRSPRPVVSASIGVAVVPAAPSTRRPTPCSRRADAAMYRSKQGGRDRVTVVTI